MPSNVVQINYSKKLKWYVGDSKMESLIKYLDEVASRDNEESTSSDASS